MTPAIAQGKRPKVSIGMPVYNGATFIRQSLESLLQQEFEDFEIIINDNASEDTTEAICREFAARDPRVTYSRNDKNLGAAPNYNKVFEAASGEYFKWASHDDTCSPQLLKECVAALDEHLEAVIAFSRFAYIDEHGEVIRPGGGHKGVRGADPATRARQLFSRQLANYDVYWAIFGLIRVSALRQTRLIEPYLASDRTLLLHLILMGSMYEVPETLFFRREHAGESMIKHASNWERALWFDTSRRPSKIYFPTWRQLREHLAVIRRQPLGFSVALRCYWQVLRRFAHDWWILGSEIKQVLHPSTYRTPRSDA